MLILADSHKEGGDNGTQEGITVFSIVEEAISGQGSMYSTTNATEHPRTWTIEALQSYRTS